MQLLGPFDHIYSDNYLDKDRINTHYVVLAYQLNMKNNMGIVSDNQHSEIKWWSKHSLLDAVDVHKNTKAYFTAD